MPPAKKTAKPSYAEISEAKKGLSESRRRDVRLHIQQALAKSPGKFLSIREIADTPTGEYDGNPAKPSYGAISTNLFREGGVSGVESVIENGVKGARSIVVKKPRKVALKPEVLEANKAAGAAVAKRTAAKAVDFTSPSDAESRAHQGIIDRLASKAPDETPKRPGRQEVNLKPGVKTHQGILDRLTRTVYCNIILEPSRDRTWPGEEEIVGRKEFVDWLNKKNGPFYGGDRFEMIDVIGANKDQRENSGINKFYREWIDGAEDFRISAALKMMLTQYSIGLVHAPDAGKWRFSNGYAGGSRGSQYIMFLAKHGNISVRKAHEVFLDYVLDQFGEDFMARIDLVDEEGIQRLEVEADRIKDEAAKYKEANSAQAKYVEQA